MSALHVRGVALPGDDVVDLWAVDGRLTFERVPGAETVVREGWLVPGLVDVHTHPGAEQTGAPLDEAVLRRDGATHLAAGVTLLRAPGAAGRLPAWFGDAEDLPRVRSAGPWLATEGGFFAGWGRQIPAAALPDAAVEEAQASGGWCKVIADWSRGTAADREYAPTVPPDTLAEIVRRVHAIGGRVAVHSQHEDGCTAAVVAGADSLEHGMHLRHDLLDRMAAQGTVLVPTVLVFSQTPAHVRDRPPRSERMRRWITTGWDRHPALVRAAHEAGVTILAGTDGAAGTVAEEVAWLVRCGIPGEAAVAAASWTARSWLGFPCLEEGAPADVVAFDEDPRLDPTVLRRPARVILRGRVVG